MKKKWIIIISICAVLVLGAVTAAVCWFACPGIRFTGNLATFNVKEAKCYIISDDKVIDQTTMTFEGLYKYSGGVINDWEYTFKIPGYTDIIEGDVVYDECFATKVDKRWTAQYYVFRDASGQDAHLLENQEPMVIVTMDFVKNNPVARVHFAKACDRDNVWAVCADSEEEALELFRKFREP